MEFKDRLRLLRKEKDLTQGELGSKLNLSTSAISMYEKGNRTPDLETLEIFADFFNVDTDYILGRSPVKLRYDLSLMQEETFYELKDNSLDNDYREILKQPDLQFFDKIPKSDLKEYEKLFDVNMVMLRGKKITKEEKENLRLTFKKLFIKDYLRSPKK